MPGLCELCFAFEPADRKDFPLKIDQMIGPIWYRLCKPCPSIVKSLGNILRWLGQMDSQCRLRIKVEMLRNASAHHEDEGCELKILETWLLRSARPVDVLAYKGRRVYEIVMVIDIAEECFNESVFGEMSDVNPGQITRCSPN